MKKITAFASALLLGGIITFAGFATLSNASAPDNASGSTNIPTGMPQPGSGTTGGTTDDTTGDEGTETEDKWVEVNLTTSGSLGVEILYQVDVLSDVKNLRISGILNAEDWTTIKNCTNLVNLDIRNAQSYNIPQEMFYNRAAIKSVILPSTLTVIDTRAFDNSGITEITIPPSVQTISTQAFERCSALTTVTFEEGSNLQTLGEGVFQECKSLTAISLPDKVTQIPNYSFYYCNSLENIKLPSSLNAIGQYAFDNNTKLSDVNFPETLRSIREYAFRYTGLIQVHLPNRTSYIGNYAFYSCKNLEAVTLPGYIDSYDGAQFSYCPNIKTINCPRLTPPNVSGSGIPHNSGAILNVPDFAVANYKLDSFWKDFSPINGGFDSDSYEISGNLSFSNNRRLNGTPDISMTTSGSMTIDGETPFTVGNLLISSENKREYIDNQYINNVCAGQIISNTAAASAAKISVTYNLESSYWSFVSLPFDVKMTDITASNNTDFVVRYYDGAARAANGTGYAWKDVAADGTLEAGKGYIFRSAGNTTLTFTATENGSAQLFNPNVRNLALDENASENAADAGWNLVGNPYLSNYDLYYSMLTSPVTVWNSYNSNYIAYSLVDDDVILTPFQTFFIQAGDTESNAISFSTAGRQFGRTSVRAAKPARKAVSADRALFNITLSQGATADRSRVVLNEEASAAYESSCDAAKFDAMSDQTVQLYTFDADRNRLAINERPAADGLVNLGLYLPAAGEFTIGASRIDGSAILADNLTGKLYNLSDLGEVTLTSDEAGAIDDRFTLILGATGTTGISGNAVSADVTVRTENGIVSITAPEATRYTVCTADGRVAATGTVANGVAEISLNSGLYIVKAGNKTLKTIVK